MLRIPYVGQRMAALLMLRSFGCSYRVDGVSPIELPWHLNTDPEYDESCTRCEIRVMLLTVADRDEIVDLLDYDKRQGGAHGRAMIRDLDRHGLRKGDRLEPSPLLTDVAQLESVDMPHDILFWRPSRATICKHRCPLFSPELGLSPCNSICLDLLHTLYLGPMQLWCRHVMWVLLKSSIWGLLEASEGARLQVSVHQMRAALFKWYDEWAKEHPDEPLTRINNITYKMIGDQWNPRLKLKAMETYGFLVFLLAMVRKYTAQVGPTSAALLESGNCLVRYVQILKGAGANLTPREKQDTRSCSRECVSASYTKSGI
jgi:hypothetical protein